MTECLTLDPLITTNRRSKSPMLARAILNVSCKLWLKSSGAVGYSTYFCAGAEVVGLFPAPVIVKMTSWSKHCLNVDPLETTNSLRLVGYPG